MDWVTLGDRGKELLKKYRYVVLVVVIGLFLLALPDGKKQEAEPDAQTAQEEAQPDLQEALEDILSLIQGAGKVRVLLTQSEGEQTVYQTNGEQGTSGDQRRDTVILTGSDRSQGGLIQQVNPPVYLGAVVVCQGAGSASVRLAIVEAVANATGLSSDRITVLKMK